MSRDESYKGLTQEERCGTGNVGSKERGTEHGTEGEREREGLGRKGVRSRSRKGGYEGRQKCKESKEREEEVGIGNYGRRGEDGRRRTDEKDRGRRREEGG